MYKYKISSSLRVLGAVKGIPYFFQKKKKTTLLLNIYQLHLILAVLCLRTD